LLHVSFFLFLLLLNVFSFFLFLLPSFIFSCQLNLSTIVASFLTSKNNRFFF
jgi:hypothetical protein